MSFTDILLSARNLRNMLDRGTYDTDQYEDGVNELLSRLEQPVAVYLLTIDTEYDTTVTVHASYKDALEGLYRFVVDTWEYSMGYDETAPCGQCGAQEKKRIVPDMPTDKAAAVSEYFATMVDTEGYDINQAIIGM